LPRRTRRSRRRSTRRSSICASYFYYNSSALFAAPPLRYSPFPSCVVQVAAAYKAQSEKIDEEIEYLRQVRCTTEAQVNLKRAEMRKLVQEENKQIAEQQKATKTYLDKVVYPGKIEDHYFNQFNTNSR